MQDRVGVPYMFNDSRDPADLIELVHPVGHQTGGEKDKQRASHLEEAFHGQPDGGGEDELDRAGRPGMSPRQWWW